MSATHGRSCAGRCWQDFGGLGVTTCPSNQEWLGASSAFDRHSRHCTHRGPCRLEKPKEKTYSDLQSVTTHTCDTQVRRGPRVYDVSSQPLGIGSDQPAESNALSRSFAIQCPWLTVLNISVQSCRVEAQQARGCRRGAKPS